MIFSNLFGQNKLRDNIVSDSLIRKFKIKQVTENWFHDSLKTPPANTTVEKYNEFGQKTQRIYINYLYHKFIDKYDYNKKKNLIIKTELFYDWNPYRKKRNGDTIVEKTVTKYYFNSRRKRNTKPSRLVEFHPKFTFDKNNRIIERIDTIKCGYNITTFTFDKNNHVIERKYYKTHHSETPNLFAIDSLQYNINGQLVRETNYYDIKMDKDKWKFNREVVKTYTYYQNGLVKEKVSITKHHKLSDSNFTETVSRYKYEFY